MEKPNIQKKQENFLDKTKRKFKEYKKYGVGFLRTAMVAMVLESCGEKTPELLEDYVAQHATIEEMAEDQKSWLESYIKSEKYKERLTREVTEYAREADLGGKTIPEVVDSIINERLSNLSTCAFVMGNLEDAEQGHVRAEYMPGPNHHVVFSSLTAATTPVHEFTHASTLGVEGIIPSSSRDFIKLFFSNIDLSRMDNKDYNAFDYPYRPNENKSRVNEVRMALDIAGKYDPKTEEFTFKHYIFLKENFSKLFPKESPIEEMLLFLPPGKFVEMMNKFAVEGQQTVPNIFNINGHVEAVA